MREAVNDVREWFGSAPFRYDGARRCAPREVPMRGGGPARIGTAVLATVLLAASPALAQSALPAETPGQKAARMAWWTEARFGMFIHWGLYAQAARHEWVKRNERMTEEQYRRYFERFDPDMFDPRAWARLAKAAGMRYFVITAKHHEGFCLWDSAQTDYKAPRTPAGRDLLLQAIEAFRAEGLKVGLYYSLLDWHHPEYPVDRHHPRYEDGAFRAAASGRDIRKYNEYVFAQVRELLTGYGPVDVLFLDYSFPEGKDGKGRADWQSERLLALVRSLQPGIIVNDRLDLDDVPGGWDFRTPEQFVPRTWVTWNGVRVPWETCQTFSGSWGYYRDEETWKSTEQLVALLVETVSKGGNLLLNVGPSARGTLDPRATARLEGVGEWMRVNGRAIHGCTQAPPELAAPANCLLTWNPRTRRLYVHVLAWPLGNLFLPGYAGKVEYAQLLHDASEVRFARPDAPFQGALDTVPDDTVILRLPVKKPDVAVPVIELFIRD
jgi:alpha-L-fucosidase